MRNSKKFNPNLIFLLAGVFFMAIGVFIFIRNADFKKNGVVATAVITDIVWRTTGDENEYDVYVEFTANGERISGELDVYETGFYEGKEVRILYMPDDPHRFIYYRHTNILPSVFLILGGLAVAVAIIPIIRKSIDKSKIKKFKENGIVKHGKVSRIEPTKGVSVNGSSPCLISVFDDVGTLYEKKRFLGKDGLCEGDEVTIYVNPEKDDDFVFEKIEKNTDL